MGSLRSFIKDVRAAKTLAEERSIITKESAKIRTKLKDDHISLEKRRKYIHKLLYLYILGEKTHFAQVECINLIASDDFADKRIGYLAAILLLDEDQELLTLLTNLLNNDLNHPMRFVVSLALNALGALTSVELARDLYADVSNILEHSRDPFLIKKALLCSGKLITRDPSLLEVFAPYATKMMLNRETCTHGVLLGTNKLIQSIILNSGSYEFDNLAAIMDRLGLLIPDLLATVTNLNSSKMDAQYMVGGLCDPFLQVETLYTLRLFFQYFPSETEKYKDKFSDALTNIATSTPSNANSGVSVLYETVRTIFAVQFDQSLRVLAVNILANFLGDRDSNTKYVALNALLQAVSVEPHAVQRHRRYISRCIFDPDVSIRMRALEMTFAVLNETNMKELVKDLLIFLQKSEENDKSSILYSVDQLMMFFDMHELKDEKWKLDVIVQILKFVGEFITLERISDALIMINNTADIDYKKEVIGQILRISFDRNSNEVSEENMAWRVVTIWCIGEYGDLILGQENIGEENLTTYLYSSNSAYGDNTMVINYILMAALKLSAKLQNPSLIENLRQLIKSHTENINVMIQSKAVQYGVLFNQSAKVKLAVLQPMPIFHKKLAEASVSKALNTKNSPANSKPKSKDNEFLLDLLGDIPSTSNKETKPATMSTDLLSDIFNNTSAPAATSNPQISRNESSTLTMNSSIQTPDDALPMFNSANLEVLGKVLSISDGCASIDMFIKAKEAINALQVLIAVSKTQKVQFSPLSNHNMKTGQVAKQHLKISGSGRLKMRVKLNFNSTQDQFDYKFDQSL